MLLISIRESIWNDILADAKGKAYPSINGVFILSLTYTNKFWYIQKWNGVEISAELCYLLGSHYEQESRIMGCKNSTIWSSLLETVH